MDLQLTYMRDDVNCRCEVSYKMENRMKCKAEERGLRKVRITRNVNGWPIGFIGWLDLGEKGSVVWNDDMTKKKHHTVGSNCEYVMEKAGTLAELGVHVGDVVEFTRVKNGYEKYSYLSGTRMTVLQDGGVSFLDPKWGWTDGFSDDCGHIFSLISRAQPKGPVITETVTRIVEGVYGWVEVGSINEDGEVYISICDRLSRDDLTAAIETLTAVRDAMPAVS